MVRSSIYRLTQDVLVASCHHFKCETLQKKHGIQYVNHTFKSHLSLSAALQVFATNPKFDLLEFPAAGSKLSHCLVSNPYQIDDDGFVRVKDLPGLGVTVDTDAIRPFLAPVRIEVGGKSIFEQSIL